MNAKDIYELLKKEFGEAITHFQEEEPSEPFIVVKSDKIFDICLFLRDDSKLLFDYLACLSGLDNGEMLSVVYHLDSFKFKHRLVLKTFVPKDKPKLPTIERVWRTADWHERECYDMFGVMFEGHHNHIRILCPYDWEGYPLRKDYQQPEVFHGMKVPY